MTVPGAGIEVCASGAGAGASDGAGDGARFWCLGGARLLRRRQQRHKPRRPQWPRQSLSLPPCERHRRLRSHLPCHPRSAGAPYLPPRSGVASLMLLLAGVTAFFLRHGAGEQRSAAGAEQPSVAVLPFADVSPNQDDASFIGRPAGRNMNALGRLQGLRVLGRTSSFFAFKGHNEDVRKIAATLGVSHVLEGSVRRDGDKLRITAQLVDASSGLAKMGRDSVDGTLSDDVRRAGADRDIRRLGSAAEARASPTRCHPWRNNEPCRVRGSIPPARRHQHAGITDARKAIDDLERAVTIDPQFALAWAALAEAHVRSGLPARFRRCC